MTWFDSRPHPEDTCPEVALPHYSVGYGGSRDGHHFLISRRPWWAAAAERVADWVCGLTRNHSCPHVCGPVLRWTDRYEDRFEIPADADLIARYASWRGWPTPWFVEDDDPLSGIEPDAAEAQ